MRSIIVLLLIFFQITSFGQKIHYDIPDGFEKDIGKADYKKIVDISVQIVAERYAIDIVKDGTIHLSKGQDMQAFNLDNLILKCAAVADKSKWDDVIQQHFHSMFSAIDAQKEIDVANYETIKKYLSVRIYPSVFINEKGGASSFIVRNDLEGTYTLLMLDLPNAFTPVQKQMFDSWKKDAAEVFKIAISNISTQQVEKVTKTITYDKINVEISFLGNEDYAASYALDLLNNSPELVGEWGSVLAIPNKGLVNICKISKQRPVDFVKFIQMTKPLIEKSYLEHQQPISDQFFWYFENKFTRIDVLVDDSGKINVISPAGLTALMTEKN